VFFDAQSGQGFIFLHDGRQTGKIAVISQHYHPSSTFRGLSLRADEALLGSTLATPVLGRTASTFVADQGRFRRRQGTVVDHGGIIGQASMRSIPSQIVAIGATKVVVLRLIDKHWI